MRLLKRLTAIAVCLCSTAAYAQDPIDIGTVLDDDRIVVQRLLYPTQDRTELGLHLGVMPFDAYLFTPKMQFSFDQHVGRAWSLSALAGGGYGIENGTLRELKTPAFGKIPDAYRYLGSVVVGATWAPIYGKISLNGAKILHHDLFVSARAGATLEQSIIPGGGVAVSPTVSLGVGSRVWIGENYAMRIALRDDLLLQRRQLTESTHLKQNVAITVGITRFSSVAQRSR